MSRAVFRPIKGRADEIVQFILQTEEVRACPDATYAVRLACEEVVVNILHYAYPEGAEGYLGVSVSKDNGTLRIAIRDGGVPFDPTGKEAPDTDAAPEERAIGGLGIFLVRQMMDEVSYTHQEGENRLLLVKHIAP